MLEAPQVDIRAKFGPLSAL